MLSGRMGQPQYLSQVRYDRVVRTHLLKQAIETGVARRMEAVFDAGVCAHLTDMLNLRDGRHYNYTGLTSVDRRLHNMHAFGWWHKYQLE
jgi:hypothetical protein